MSEARYLCNSEAEIQEIAERLERHSRLLLLLRERFPGVSENSILDTIWNLEESEVEARQHTHSINIGLATVVASEDVSHLHNKPVVRITWQHEKSTPWPRFFSQDLDGIISPDSYSELRRVWFYLLELPPSRSFGSKICYELTDMVGKKAKRPVYISQAGAKLDSDTTRNFI